MLSAKFTTTMYNVFYVKACKLSHNSSFMKYRVKLGATVYTHKCIHVGMYVISKMHIAHIAQNNRGKCVCVDYTHESVNLIHVVAVMAPFNMFVALAATVYNNILKMFEFTYFDSAYGNLGSLAIMSHI